MRNSVTRVGIVTFGRIQVSGTTRRDIDFPTRKDLALLVLLACQPGVKVTREKLTGLLWSHSDEAHARRSLRQSLIHLRKCLLPESDAVLSADSHGVWLDAESVWSDVAEFETLVASGDLEDAARALALYEGPFGDELNVDEPEFDRWLHTQRQRLHNLAVAAAERLLDDAHREGDSGRLIDAATEVLRLDPLREDIHRVLIEAYAAQGQRTRAIQQYEACRDVLARDLDLEPDLETERIVAAIRQCHSPSQPQDEFVAGPSPSNVQAPHAPRVSKRAVGGSLALGLLLLAVFGMAWNFTQPDIKPASINRMAYSLPDKPSIAVLPIAGLGLKSESNVLGEALTDRLITELSRFPQLFVIARSSSFAYENEPAPIWKVSEDLGVRYVVEGTLQNDSGRVRVNVRLVDALSGSLVWGEQYDRQLEDGFALQDDIARTVVATLYGKVVGNERKRIRRLGPEFLKAYEYTERALETYLRWSEETTREARKLLEKAIQADPTYVRAYWVLTGVYREGHRMGWFDMARKEALRLARETAEKAMVLDPHDYHAHWAMAKVYREEGKPREALKALERALELNPNNAMLAWDTGSPLVFLGRFQEAAERYKKAMRLNPHHPSWWYWNLAWAQYYLGEYEAALASMKRLEPLPINASRMMAVIYVRLGKIEAAKTVIANYLDSKPGQTVDHARTMLSGKFIDPDHLDQYLEDLRKAGLPDASAETQG